jgi:hypothetical protein
MMFHVFDTLWAGLDCEAPELDSGATVQYDESSLGFRHQVTSLALLRFSSDLSRNYLRMPIRRIQRNEPLWYAGQRYIIWRKTCQVCH